MQKLYGIYSFMLCVKLSLSNWITSFVLMLLANQHHFNIGGFLFMLIAKAFNLTGIAGGCCSSLTSSLGTIAKSHEKDRTGMVLRNGHATPSTTITRPITKIFISHTKQLLYCILKIQ